VFGVGSFVPKSVLDVDMCKIFVKVTADVIHELSSPAQLHAFHLQMISQMQERANLIIDL
jgi:hypothetical protein